MMTDSRSTTSSKHLRHQNYRADIDGLRAVAVLSVVGFHAFPDWIGGGFIGVDIFFVISGFLISTIIFNNLNNDSFSFLEFYSRRIKRIFPALLLVLTASFVLGWFLLLPTEYKQLGKHIAGGAGFISNFLFWNESGYFDNAADTKPLLHLWSLGIEEQFYIAWPLLLWLAWWKKISFLKLTAFFAIVSFVLNIWQSTINGDWVAAFYSPQTRFWELLIGAVLAHIMLQTNGRLSYWKLRLDSWLESISFLQTRTANGETRHNLQSLLGIGLIAFGLIVISKDRIIPGWWAVLPTLGSVLVISAGSHAWINRFVLSNRIFVWFGLISYPLYLWHWPLLSFAHISAGKFPSIEIRVAALILSIILAWITFHFLERPIRFGKLSKEKTLALFVLMSVVGYFGFYISKGDGLDYRFPKIVRELMAYKRHIARGGDGACFLSPLQNYSSFSRCSSQDVKDKRPTLLLWGDSNAAHLYVGYKASFGREFQIITRTSSLCPPILNMEIKSRPYCKTINDFIFTLIKHNKPQKVVLAAIWNEYDWMKIAGTINQLHQIGITDIDLIGPVPRWTDNLPRLLFLKFSSDVFRRIPERMEFGLRKDVIQLDPVLFNFSQKLKVNYISPIKILCNANGCLTRLGETSDTLTAFDHVHLTNIGSQYLVSRFPKANLRGSKQHLPR